MTIASIITVLTSTSLDRRAVTLVLLIGLNAITPGSTVANDHEKLITAAEEGERIFSEICIACHGEGVNGAPKPGVKADWEPRLSYGIDNLYISAFDGLSPYMPPRGTCMDCTDHQLKSVVNFMVSNLK